METVLYYWVPASIAIFGFYGVFIGYSYRKHPAWLTRLRLLFMIAFTPIVVAVASYFLALYGFFPLIYGQLYLLLLLLPLLVPLYSWALAGIQPLRFRSIAFDITSPEYEFERRIMDRNRYSPSYDERISRKQATSLLQTIPIEVYNRSGQPVVVREVFTEIFRPEKIHEKLHYDKKPTIRSTAIGVENEFPAVVAAKSAIIIKMATKELLRLGHANEVRFVERMPMEEPYIRLGVISSAGQFLGRKTYFGNFLGFLSMMFVTMRRKAAQELVDALLARQSKPEELVDKITELYSTDGPSRLTDPLIGMYELLSYLKESYPSNTDYVKEVERRIDASTEALNTIFREILSASGFLPAERASV